MKIPVAYTSRDASAGALSDHVTLSQPAALSERDEITAASGIPIGQLGYT